MFEGNARKKECHFDWFVEINEQSEEIERMLGGLIRKISVKQQKTSAFVPSAFVPE